MKSIKQLLLVTAILLMLYPTNAFAGISGLDSFPDEVDPQSWVLPRDMTWDDYKGIPTIDWNETDIEPDRVMRGALILVDFPDQDFILTMKEGSDLAGNPRGISELPREDVPEFWNNYLNVPNEMNHFQTIDGYWKENSYGKWGVEFDTYGPYELDYNMFQYSSSFGKVKDLPPGYQHYDIKPHAIAKAQADIDASGEKYDFRYIVHAGYDESSVWQEFGEMMFMTKEDVTDEYGSPFSDLPNWSVTRYVPWTSWFAGHQIWTHARGDITVQGESDGMATFAHEFAHVNSLGDNYNNPYAIPVSRSYTGPWEVMSRGHINGPGGTHTRYFVPNSHGGTVPAHHTLRNKIKQGFLSDDEVLQLDRDGLSESGPVFADIVARAVPLGSKFNRTGLHGVNISMEDRTPRNSLLDEWRADMQNGERWYNNYTIEVVDRVGSDSFTPDSGVLIAKTKNTERSPNIWIVDSHPEDINLWDFTRPDGSTAMMSKGDYQQLADATFHAGSGKTLIAGNYDHTIDSDDVVSEYIDEYNRLHFYILDKNYDDAGVLSYRVAVRHLDGSGDFERSVKVNAKSAKRATPGKVAEHTFRVTNTGETTDIFRIEANTGASWKTMILHDVIEVEAGETVDVPVYVEIPENAAPTQLTFTATSETDTDQVAMNTDVLLSDISIENMKIAVDIFAASGDINEDAVHPLTVHLTALGHFERTGNTEKLNKHIDGFIVLVNHHKDSGSISEKAAQTLLDYAELLKK